MAVIARRIKRFTGELTTDGAGAATADVVFGSAGGVAAPALLVPSYKLIKVILENGAAADNTVPLTGGTVVIRDNSGAGSAINKTVTVDGSEGLSTTAGSVYHQRFNARAAVTNVRLTIAGGGASKKLQYQMWFARTKAQ